MIGLFSRISISLANSYDNRSYEYIKTPDGHKKKIIILPYRASTYFVSLRLGRTVLTELKKSINFDYSTINIVFGIVILYILFYILYYY